MKVACERDKLLAAFQIASAVAPTRSPKPILQNVKFEAHKDSVVLTATDLEVGVRVQVSGVTVDVAAKTAEAARLTAELTKRQSALDAQTSKVTSLEKEVQALTAKLAGADMIVGVDIGASGALAFLTPEGELVAVEDMPTLRDGPKGRPAVSGALLAAILPEWRERAGQAEPAPGSDFCSQEDRMRHVIDLCEEGKYRPDICTLDCGSLNFGDGNRAYVSTPNYLRQGAAICKDLGVKPEFEIFDTGNLWFVKQMIKEGLVLPPPLIQLCMGIAYGAPDE